MIRRVRWLILVTLAVVGLAGCDSRLSLYNGPVSLSQSEGTLEFVFCAPIEANDGWVSVKKAGGWSRAWSSDDRLVIEAGEVATLGGTPFGGSATIDDPVRADEVDEVMIVVQSPKDALAGSFLRPAAGWPEAEWIHPDGTITAEPCPAKDGSR